MGNTASTIVLTIKRSTQYTLCAADAAEIWRYPRLDLRQEKREAASDLETIIEVIHVRVNMVRDQMTTMGGHLVEIMWHLWGILFRLWRLVYHLGMMADEVGAEIAEMAQRLTPVTLELLERARERRIA